jgi:hypothetical protein
LAALQQSGYVIVVGVFCEIRTFGSFRLHTPQSGLSTQIAWVLYGQASRAISIG